MSYQIFISKRGTRPSTASSSRLKHIEIFLLHVRLVAASIAGLNGINAEIHGQEFFYREERALSAITLDALTKRIATNETKLRDVQTKGGGKEADRLAAVIETVGY